MKSRTYGTEPYKAVVLHGGPGGIGDVRDLAQFISGFASVLEPFMKEKTIKDQLQELKSIIQNPLTIVGYSWGAMIAILFAYQFPEFSKKLILIGCPPLDIDSEVSIMETRLERLESKDQNSLLSYIKAIPNSTGEDKKSAFMHIKRLIDKADLINPIDFDYSNIDFCLDVYEALWPQTKKLRNDGVFIESIKNIKIPIVFIHGKYDPHPIKNIEKIIPSLYQAYMYKLEESGHTPWLERTAKEEFFDIIKNELKE